MSVPDRPHTWTLPLSPDRWAYIQMPARTVTEDEWAQLLHLLEVFKPGLVLDPVIDLGQVRRLMVAA